MYQSPPEDRPPPDHIDPRQLLIALVVLILLGLLPVALIVLF